MDESRSMLANVVSKVLVVSNGAAKGQVFHATMWPAILDHAGLAIVLSIAYLYLIRYLLRALSKACVVCLLGCWGSFSS